MRPWARIVCDSIGPHGIRLTTMEMMGWQASHPDFMTHRMFSRNAASTRAIPARRFREQAASDPFWPIAWDADQPGMQGYQALNGSQLARAQRAPSSRTGRQSGRRGRSPRARSSFRRTRCAPCPTACRSSW